MNFNNNRFSRREILFGSGCLAVISAGGNPLSSEQKAIILGNLLGDGHLQLAPNTLKARLKFTHSIAQREYVEWEYKKLGWLCEKVKQPYETVTKKGYHECIAYTSYEPQLLEYHQLFYRPSTKRGRRFEKFVPENLSSYLTDPTSLMVWYLDDGTRRPDGGACRLATQGFTYSEQEILQDCLKKNFNIQSKIEPVIDPQKEVVQYNLAILTREGHADKFLKLFDQRVLKEIPSMKYKVQRKPSI
jgi:hypothetical protein